MQELARFQADITPNGSISMAGFWHQVARLEGEAPVAGELKLGFQRSYSSLEEANQKALEFPGFSDLAEQFKTDPFNAFCQLLEALKIAYEAERNAALEGVINIP
jgi:hypothetical protein